MLRGLGMNINNPLTGTEGGAYHFIIVAHYKYGGATPITTGIQRKHPTFLRSNNNLITDYYR